MILIDSPYLCYRSFYAPGVREMGGNYVLGGFLSELLTVFSGEVRSTTGYEPRQFLTTDGLFVPTQDDFRMVFCWDSKKSLRRNEFPEYKQHRHTETTEEEHLEKDEFYRQMNLLRTHVLPSIGFNNNIVQSGLESDDMIAMLVEQSLTTDSVRIVSSDKDLWQVIGPNCIWKDPWNKKSMTPSLLKRTLGITPEQWHQVIALAGCKSDGVPGVPGVGPKGAVAYLLGQLKEGAKKQAIESAEGKAVYRRNLRLVFLPHKATKPVELKKDEVSFKKLKSVLLEYEMPGLLRNRIQDWKALCAILQQ